MIRFYKEELEEVKVFYGKSEGNLSYQKSGVNHEKNGLHYGKYLFH